MALISPITMIQQPPGRKPPFGTPLNRSHPLAQGLVGAWLFNEGGGNKVTDATIYNPWLHTRNNDILSCSWNTGPNGRNILFNGTTSPASYIKLGISNNYGNYFSNGITILTSCKCIASAANKTIFSADSDTSTARFIRVNITADEKPYFVTFNNTTTYYECLSDTILTNGLYYHLAFSCDNVKNRIYINGVFNKEVNSNTLNTSTNNAATTIGMY